jgi:hypothetical protein
VEGLNTQGPRHATAPRGARDDDIGVCDRCKRPLLRYRLAAMEREVVTVGYLPVAISQKIVKEMMNVPIEKASAQAAAL